MIPVNLTTQKDKKIILPTEEPLQGTVEPQKETVAAPFMESLSDMDKFTDNELLDLLSCPHFPWPAECPKDVCIHIAQMVPRNLPEQNGFVVQWLQECTKRNLPGFTENEQTILAAQLFLRYKFGILEGSQMNIKLQEVCKKAKKEGEEKTKRLLFTLISTPDIDANNLLSILENISNLRIENPIQKLLISCHFKMTHQMCGIIGVEYIRHDFIEDNIISTLSRNPLPCLQEEALFEDWLAYHPLSFLVIWSSLSDIQKGRVSETLRSYLQSNLPYLIKNLYMLKDTLPEVITSNDILEAILEKIKQQSENTDILSHYYTISCFDETMCFKINEFLNQRDIIKILSFNKPINELLINRILPFLLEIPYKDLSRLLTIRMHDSTKYKIISALHEQGVLKGALSCISEQTLANILGSIYPYLEDLNQLHLLVDFIESSGDIKLDVVSHLNLYLPSTVTRRLLSTLLEGSDAVRNRCLECGLWRLDPDFVEERCDVKTLLEHAPEILNPHSISDELREDWFSNLLKKGCNPEMLLVLFGEKKEALLKHFLENNPEKLLRVICVLCPEDFQRVVSYLIENHPLLAFQIEKKFSDKITLDPEQYNQLFEILLNASPQTALDMQKISKEQRHLALKKLAERDPQAAVEYIIARFGMSDLLENQSKEAAAIYCALYFQVCPLCTRSPELMTVLMWLCAAYLNTHGVPPGLARQADHRKLFQILLDGLEPSITQEDKRCLEYLLADRTFKDYRDNREIIWRTLLVIGDAPIPVKQKRKILHYLAGKDTEKLRSTRASELLKRANTLILMNMLPNGLEQVEHADQALAHFMQTILPSMPENFLERYSRTFHTWQDPLALVHYVFELNRNMDPCPEKDQLLQCCAQFIHAVFDGPEKWRELRRAETKHMNEVERLSSPELLEMWSQEMNFPISQVIEDGVGISSSADLKTIFYTVLITDGHLPGFETFFPRLHAILTAGPQPTILTLEPLQALEELLITSISSPDCFTIEVLKEIEQTMQNASRIAPSNFLKDICDTIPSSQFAQDIRGLIQQLDKASTKLAHEALQVVETDDPEMLFLVPTLIPGSCQSVYAKTDTNQCLMGYVLDPKNRMIVVKTSDGKPVARGILRMLLTYDTGANSPTRSEPALFLERLYPQVLDPYIAKAIIAMAKIKARTLRIPLHISDQTLPPQMVADYSTEKFLSSIDSAAPFEYCDSALPLLDRETGEEVSYHINRGFYYVDQNEVDTGLSRKETAHGTF